MLHTHRILALLTVALLGLLPTARAQSLAALDAQEGFFDFRFGARMDTLKGTFIKFDNFQKKERFTLKGQVLDFSGVPLRDVRYVFYDQRLHSIIVRTETAPHSDALLEVLVLFYGPGVQDGMSPRYYWKGQRVWMSYDKNLLNGNATVEIMSVEMQKLFEKDFIEVIKDY